MNNYFYLGAEGREESVDEETKPIVKLPLKNMAFKINEQKYGNIQT